MERESSIKEKKAARRAREKRKKQLILASGIAGVLLLAVIMIGMISSGGEKYDADTNTVYLLEDGKIISVSVEDFDEQMYDKNELNAYIEETINDYNTGNGEEVAKQKLLEVKDGVAKLVLEYENAQVFEDIEGVELFSGTMSEAIAAGYTFTEHYADVRGETAKKALGSEFMKDMDYKVAVIKANTTVQVDGTICFVSIENTAEVKENQVVIKAGTTLKAEGFAEESVVETESVTESEVLEGAVGEDELEVGMEMIFDFGEEDTEEKNQYKDVYTYIIYK